jgi:hypothetical protein
MIEEITALLQMYFHLLEGPVQEVQFKGDIWTISAVGTLGGVAVSLGDTVRALSDAPVQVVGSWSIAEGNLGYTPYNSSNPAGYTSNLGTVTSIGLSGGTTE